jgi:hypothetical protein
MSRPFCCGRAHRIGQARDAFGNPVWRHEVLTAVNVSLYRVEPHRAVLNGTSYPPLSSTATLRPCTVRRGPVSGPS